MNPETPQLSPEQLYSSFKLAVAAVKPAEQRYYDARREASQRRRNAQRAEDRRRTLPWDSLDILRSLGSVDVSDAYSILRVADREEDRAFNAHINAMAQPENRRREAAEGYKNDPDSFHGEALSDAGEAGIAINFNGDVAADVHDAPPTT